MICPPPPPKELQNLGPSENKRSFGRRRQILGNHANFLVKSAQRAIINVTNPQVLSLLPERSEIPRREGGGQTSGVPLNVLCVASAKNGARHGGGGGG